MYIDKVAELIPPPEQPGVAEPQGASTSPTLFEARGMSRVHALKTCGHNGSAPRSTVLC